MSGKRQHFVPQFVQRGFASHTSGKDVFTWVYRNDKTPFNTNIKNVGIEGGFYSRDGNQQVDDYITDAEGRLSLLIGAMRSTSDGAFADTRGAAELVAHLEARSRHLRQNFVHIGSVAFEQILQFISNEETFVPYMLRRMEQDPSMLHSAIEEDLRKRGLPITMAPLLLRLSKPLLSAIVPKTTADFAKIASALRSQLPTIVQTAAKSGQLGALKEAIAPPLKVQHYRQFSYEVFNVAGQRLPLGDSMVLFHIEGDRGFRSFTQADETVLAIYLPISSTQVLVGKRGAYTPALSLLPDAIAKCSLEHFVADRRAPELEALQAQLGKSASILSQAEIESLLMGAFDG